MGGCVELLKPLVGDEEGAAVASVLIGTVKGDLHDIGKNLVAMMMESAGLEVHNLGVDIAPEDFVAEIKKEKCPDCLSALLTSEEHPISFRRPRIQTKIFKRGDFYPNSGGEYELQNNPVAFCYVLTYYVA